MSLGPGATLVGTRDGLVGGRGGELGGVVLAIRRAAPEGTTPAQRSASVLRSAERAAERARERARLDGRPEPRNGRFFTRAEIYGLPEEPDSEEPNSGAVRRAWSGLPS